MEESKRMCTGDYSILDNDGFYLDCFCPHYDECIHYINHLQYMSEIRKTGKNRSGEVEYIYDNKKNCNRWRNSVKSYSKSYVHGSPDSVDKDIVYIIDEPMEPDTSKKLCEILDGNSNLAVIKDGHIVWCYKGVPDELNNSMYRTVPLHKENKDNPISGPVERDVCMKVIRAVRIILSHMSRSQYRNKIKSALRGGWKERLDTLWNIKLEEIDFDSLNKNMSGKDVLKVIAFQTGQTLALIDGVEVYTKGEISDFLPILGPALYRESEPRITSVELMLLTLIEKIKKMGIVDNGNGTVEYLDKTYDIINEKIV